MCYTISAAGGGTCYKFAKLPKILCLQIGADTCYIGIFTYPEGNSKLKKRQIFGATNKLRLWILSQINTNLLRLCTEKNWCNFEVRKHLINFNFLIFCKFLTVITVLIISLYYFVVILGDSKIQRTSKLKTACTGVGKLVIASISYF